MRTGMGMNRRAGTLGRWLFIAIVVGTGSDFAPGLASTPDRLELRISAGSGAAVQLLARLWDSGFFRRCPALRDEICDNAYAFFDPGSQLASLQKKGMACFCRSPEGKDTVYLREDIFAHYKVGLDGVFARRSVDEPALKVLVHELCHDFWINILDERERVLFTIEGAAFLDGYRQAVAAGERRKFVLSAGWGGRKSDLASLASELDSLIGSYPPELLCGTELFAWFGERAYSIGLRMPPTFRKFYARLIASVSTGTETPSS